MSKQDLMEAEFERLAALYEEQRRREEAHHRRLLQLQRQQRADAEAAAASVKYGAALQQRARREAYRDANVAQAAQQYGRPANLYARKPDAAIVQASNLLHRQAAQVYTQRDAQALDASDALGRALRRKQRAETRRFDRDPLLGHASPYDAAVQKQEAAQERHRRKEEAYQDRMMRKAERAEERILQRQQRADDSEDLDAVSRFNPLRRMRRGLRAASAGIRDWWQDRYARRADRYEEQEQARADNGGQAPPSFLKRFFSGAGTGVERAVHLAGLPFFGQTGLAGTASVLRSHGSTILNNMSLHRTAQSLGMLRSHGVVGAGLHGAGGGLIDMFTRGYHTTLGNTNAILNLARAGFGRSAGTAYRYGMGYNPREVASMMHGYKGAGSLAREDVTAMMRASSMGAGGEFSSLMGLLHGKRSDLAQTGVRSPMKILAELFATQLVGRFEKGRFGDMIRAFTSMASTVSAGTQVNRGAISGVMAMLGRGGFRPDDVGHIGGSLDRFVRGHGGVASDVFSMFGAGFGKNKDFFQSRAARWGGAFGLQQGEDPNEALERLRGTFQTAKSFLPTKSLRLDMLSQELGLSPQVLERIEKLLESQKTSPEALLKAVQAESEKEKPLRERAYEAMASFGGFKNVEMRLEKLHDTLGRMIAPTMLRIFNALLDVADNTLMTYLATFAAIPKGTASKLYGQGGFKNMAGYALALGAAFFGKTDALQGAIAEAHGDPAALQFEIQQAKARETIKARQKVREGVNQTLKQTEDVNKDVEKKTSFIIHIPRDFRQEEATIQMERENQRVNVPLTAKVIRYG